MSIVHQICPSCSAPLDIPEEVTKVKCPYCGSSLAIQRQGSVSATSSTQLASSPISSLSHPQTSSGASRNYAWLLLSFSGRLTRGGYWLGIVIAFALFMLTTMIASATGGAENSGVPTPLSCLMMLSFILFVWIGAAVSIKRYHDLGKSGLWVLIILIPLIGVLWQLIELGLFPGTVGPNKYG